MSGAAVVRPDGELLPIRAVTFHYEMEWRGLRGETHAAALASVVSTWVFAG